jgi:hypothetical protein
LNLDFDKATLEDALYIADHLRPSDREECNAHTEAAARTTLETAWKASSHTWTAKSSEGTPIAILGLVPAPGMSDTGIPWLLCTEEAEAMPKAFLKYTPEYLAVFLAIYPKLFNVVTSTSTKTLTWLKRLGFTLGKSMPSPKLSGVQVTPFYKVSA